MREVGFGSIRMFRNRTVPVWAWKPIRPERRLTPASAPGFLRKQTKIRRQHIPPVDGDSNRLAPQLDLHRIPGTVRLDAGGPVETQGILPSAALRPKQRAGLFGFSGGVAQRHFQVARQVTDAITFGRSQSQAAVRSGGHLKIESEQKIGVAVIRKQVAELPVIAGPGDDELTVFRFPGVPRAAVDNQPLRSFAVEEWSETVFGGERLDGAVDPCEGLPFGMASPCW